MANIFISYSRKDREIARLLAEFLDGRGYSVWWDHDLHAGENYRRQIKAQLEGANAAVVIWSPNAKDSDWVNDEALAALRAGKLISTHTADFEPYNDTPYGFGGQHMVPVVAHEEIARAVQALLVNSSEAAAKGAVGARATRAGEPRVREFGLHGFGRTCPSHVGARAAVHGRCRQLRSNSPRSLGQPWLAAECPFAGCPDP